MHKLKLDRQQISIALGALWILDGLLQLQHQMFTPAFIQSVIYPAVNGQPGYLYSFIHFAGKLFLYNPTIFNSLIVIVQLAIGILIIRSSTRRLGLVVSIFWSLVVWILGESLGGILSGHAMLLSGAPGAALIYGLIALSCLHMDRRKEEENNPLPAAWLVLVWAAYWLLGAVYQLLPGQNKAADVSMMISSNSSGAPQWLSKLDAHITNLIAPTNSMMPNSVNNGHMAMTYASPNTNLWIIVVMVLVFVLIGLAAIPAGYSRKLAVISGIVLSLVFWVVGQNLGGYYTGLATDPNAAPLVVLLGLSILPLRNMWEQKNHLKVR